MRIMIIGDIASGKSTFATRLGAACSLSVLHLDEVMENMGRENRGAIGEFIRKEANKDDWIIDGNAFTKDKTYRIERADTIIVFSARPIVTFCRHVFRWWRMKTNKELRVGAQDSRLNLRYYVPYIFRLFPKRKQEAIDYAASLKKRIIIINGFQNVDEYLNVLTQSINGIP